MKKIRNNKFLYNFVSETVLALILFPLIDMFFRVVIEKKEFIYSVNEHIIGAILFGLFFAFFTIILNKIDTKKNHE